MFVYAISQTKKPSKNKHYSLDKIGTAANVVEFLNVPKIVEKCFPSLPSFDTDNRAASNWQNMNALYISPKFSTDDAICAM